MTSTAESKRISKSETARNEDERMSNVMSALVDLAYI